MSRIDTIDTSHFPLRWAVAGGWLLVALCAAWRASAGRRAWWVVAALAAGLAFESAHPLRFTLTQSLRDAVRTAGGAGAVGARRPVQAVVVVVVLAGGAFAARRVHRSRAVGRPEKIALFGIGLAVTGIVLEVVSLHHLDQLGFVYPAFRAAGLVAAGVGAATRAPSAA